MAKIKFENGPTVEFNGNPTPQDIEEVAKKLGLSKNKSRITTEEAQAQMQQAKAEAKKATGFLKSPIRQLGSALGETFVKPYAQAVQSIPEAISAVKGGGAVTESKKPGFEYQEPMTGYLSKAQNAAIEAEQKGKSIPLAVGEKMIDPLSLLPVSEGLGLGKKGIGLAKTGIKKLIPEVNLKTATEMVMPQLDKKTRTELLKKGMTEKKGIPGLFGKITAKPSERDLENAKVAQKFLSNDPVKSVDNLSNEVSRVQNTEVLPYLQANNTPYPKATIDSILKKISEIQPTETITKADKTRLRAFNIIKDNAKKAVTTEAKDDVSLYKLRILLDNLGKQETKGKLFDEKTAISDAYRQVRNVLNDTITEGMPKGKVNFSDKLKYESQLLDIIENISEKNQSLVGKSVWTTNPWLKATKQAAPWVGGAGAGAGGSAIFNAIRNKAGGN